MHFPQGLYSRDDDRDFSGKLCLNWELNPFILKFEHWSKKINEQYFFLPIGQKFLRHILIGSHYVFRELIWVKTFQNDEMLDNDEMKIP